MNNINFFIDMDGVLAEYSEESVKAIENDDSTHFIKPGVFAKCKCNKFISQIISELIPENNVYILSKAPRSVKYPVHSEVEKRQWIKRFIPQIPQDQVFVLPYSQSKGEYVNSKFNDKKYINILIDDNTNNLLEWEDCGNNFFGIKVLNGINNTKGRWLNKYNGDRCICCVGDNSDLDNFYENVIKIKRGYANVH